MKANECTQTSSLDNVNCKNKERLPTDSLLGHSHDANDRVIKYEDPNANRESHQKRSNDVLIGPSLSNGTNRGIRRNDFNRAF